MITISEIIQEKIKKQPFLEDELHKGIINLSALARLMKPQVEKKLLKPVQLGAIIMALQRITPTVKQKFGLSHVFAKKPNILVRSHLIEYTITNSATFQPQKHFFTMTRGVFETAIIASDDAKKEIERALKKEKIIKKIENLSSITLILPKENIHTPGVYYFILKSLAWENINVIDVVSTYTEFTIILQEAEVDRAFSLLTSVV